MQMIESSQAPDEPLPDLLNRLDKSRKASTSRRRSSTSDTKPRQHTKKRVPRDEVSPERARHLERNRVAANKCRARRKEEQNQIQSLLESETEKREMLMAEVDSLREQAYELKDAIFTHARCGDGKINHHLEQMSRNVMQTADHPQAYPSPTFSSSGLSGDLATEDSAQKPVAERPDETIFDTFVNVPKQ